MPTFSRTGEDSGPGTNSIEQRGHVRVANHKGFSFYRKFFMLEIYVQFWCQRFLETGEVSWPGTSSIECRGPVRVTNHKGFFILLILMLEIHVQFCGQRFLETCEVSRPGTNSIECRGPVMLANHKGFFSIVNFHVGNLCPIPVSTFSLNRRGFMTWDQFYWMQGPARVANHKRFSF